MKLAQNHNPRLQFHAYSLTKSFNTNTIYFFRCDAREARSISNNYLSEMRFRIRPTADEDAAAEMDDGEKTIKKEINMIA